MAFKPEQEEVAQMFGNKPEDVYTSKKAEAFEDVTATPVADALMPDAMPTGDVATVEDLLGSMPEEEMDNDEKTLADQLQAVIDNEDTDADVKATAEELLARLDELSAVEQNVKDFLAENAPSDEAPADEAVAKEEEVAPEAIL